MPDEAAVAVGAGNGAASGGGAPAGGAGGGGAAPAAVPTAPQTDEQILGIDPVGTAPAEEVASPEAEQQPDPAAAAAAKTPEAEAAEKIAEDGRLMPVKWREMAKNDPEFRTLFYTSKANAEKLAQIEPKFTEMQTAVQAVEKADQTYLSGDLVAIQGELKSFLADKPEALMPMFQAGEALLKELHPQEYQRIQTERLTNTLKGNNFDAAFQVLRNALNAGDEGSALLKQQVEKILEWADGNGFPTTEQAKLAQQKAQLDAREASHRQQDEQNYNTTASKFKETVNSKIKETIDAEIKTAADKFLEKSAFADGAKARIREEIGKELFAILGAKKEIVDQIGQAIWPNGSKDKSGALVRGMFNDANQQLAIRLPVDYAKSVLNDVIKKVVEQYTKDFMASHQTSEKKLAAAASRTEVSGGTPAPRGQKPLTKKDVQGMTDEQILDA